MNQRKNSFLISGLITVLVVAVVFLYMYIRGVFFINPLYLLSSLIPYAILTFSVNAHVITKEPITNRKLILIAIVLIIILIVMSEIFIQVFDFEGMAEFYKKLS